MSYRVLLTSAGALVMPNIIRSLKDDPEDVFHIVGVDRNTDAVGLHFLDRHFIVTEEKDFCAELLRIAKAEVIDVVIPGSDQELLALSKSKEAFADEGIIVAVSSYESVTTACDKAAMLRFLVDRRLPCAKFATPGSPAELAEAAISLGYPRKPVVFKPRRSSGARGFWIIDARIRKDRDVIFSPDRQRITLDWLCEALAEAEPFPEILLMEYLPGADFNVDILAKDGNCLYTIPNQRIVPNAGPVQVGLVRQNKPVQDLCARIVAAFGFDYWINVEVARNEAGAPLAYEINPRISAPIAFNAAAGVNLLKLGIKMAMGEAVDQTLAIQGTRVMRYWNELAIPAARTDR